MSLLVRTAAQQGSNIRLVSGNISNNYHNFISRASANNHKFWLENNFKFDKSTDHRLFIIGNSAQMNKFNSLWMLTNFKLVYLGFQDDLKLISNQVLKSSGLNSWLWRLSFEPRSELFR